jgi:3-dehydroquinate synthetase
LQQVKVNRTAESVLVAVHGVGTQWGLFNLESGTGAEVAWHDPSDLLGFAEELCSRRARPRIRAVIFVADNKSAGPTVLGRTPRLICILNRAQALASSVPHDWKNFLVIDDGAGGLATLVVRDCPTLMAQTYQLPAVYRSEVAQCFGVQDLLLQSENENSQIELVCPINVRVHKAEPDAVVRGAREFALAQMHQTGVWNDDHRSLIMRDVRKVEYPVLHTAGPVFNCSEQTLADIVGKRPVLLVADATVARLHANPWRDYAEQHFTKWHELIVPVCETSKNWDEVDRICAAAADCNLPRNGVIVGVGGGVLLDTAGVAAAVFRRGVDYVRVPTTLVGLVDVAVGIKHAVNGYGKKNLLGAFYPPLASINDYSFTHTLPRTAIACGLAEIIKIALIGDEGIFDVVEKHATELVDSRFSSPGDLAQEIAFRSELLMMEELSTNLYETDHARLVDFGHTFSPTIEAASGYQIPHGVAVAVDMLLSTSIAVHRSIAGPGLFGRLYCLLNRLDLLVAEEHMPDERLLTCGLEDAKRHRGGALNLVVIARPGCPTFLQDVQPCEVESARQAVLRAGSADYAVVDLRDQYACIGL